MRFRVLCFCSIEKRGSREEQNKKKRVGFIFRVSLRERERKLDLFFAPFSLLGRTRQNFFVVEEGAIYIHTHTHTHIYIYIYKDVLVQL